MRRSARIVAALAACLLTATLLFRTPHAIRAQTGAADHPGVIVVVSSGHAKGAPDMATFRAGVEAVANTPKDALKQTDDQMRTLLSTLQQFSIADGDLQTSGLNLFPTYAVSGPQDEGPSKITGYRAANGVTVTVHDLSELSPILGALTDAGISDVGSVQFGVSDSSLLHAQAISDAVQRSRPLAEAAANAAGLALGGIAAIEELSPTGSNGPVGAGVGGGQGGPPVQGGNLNVNVQVQVAFSVQSP
jgi:uncharacterized protein YggE